MYTIKVNDITYEVNVNDCVEIDPCVHPVYITNNGKREEYYYSGVDIYELFTSLNVEVPKHFMEYKDFKGFGLFD